VEDSVGFEEREGTAVGPGTNAVAGYTETKGEDGLRIRGDLQFACCYDLFNKAFARNGDKEKAPAFARRWDPRKGLSGNHSKRAIKCRTLPKC